MNRRWLVAAALALGAAGLACSAGEADIATLTSNSDQVIWEAGLQAQQKKNWESARQHFRRIIDGFPQSEYSPAARLALAETFVKEGGDANDIMAIATYRDFLTLFPSHPKADDAQFEIGEAYFRMRSGPDRDQTQTVSALEEYQRLLELYPQSELGERARTRIGEARQSLARAEYLAGYFYQRTRQWCRAAIPRYEGILREYPDFADLDDVLLHLAECFHSEGRTAEALPLLGRIIEDYPQNPLVEQARRYQETWPAEAAARPVPPAPVPGASPAPAASPGTPADPTLAPRAPQPSPSPSPAVPR